MTCRPTPAARLAEGVAARVARRFLARTVQVTVDVEETLAARKKHPLFDKMVVGTFDSSVALYRAFDGAELKRILRSGKITGGRFSVPAARAYGASWGANITEVIQGLNRQRGQRLGADLYLAKVDGLDHRFAHLDPGIEFDPAGPSTQKATLQADKCGVGLGCSVLVDVSDVDAFFVLQPNHQLEKIEPKDLRARVEHIELEEDAPAKKEPARLHGDYPIKPRDKFIVDKGSTKLGIGVRNYGRVTDVYQMDWGTGETDTRIWLLLDFVWPLKNGDRARRTLYAIHPNVLKGFDGAGVKLHTTGGHIFIRRKPG